MSFSSSPPVKREINWPQVYLGIAFSTLAVLVLELSLTRIFSVVFYYHFAFLAISIALFGLGAGGVFSYVVAGWRGRFFDKLGWMSALNGVLVVAALVFLLSRGKEPGAGAIALVYFTTALPFFLAGAVVSLAIAETIQRVERVYFFDLLGAAAGCLLLIPFLTVYCDALGVLGGYGIVVGVYGGSGGDYWYYSAVSIETWDVMAGVIKSLFFGGAIALISCHKGFSCRPGAAGVGRATT